MTTYAKHVSTRETPQSEAIPWTSQVPNSAGGFAWAVDYWTRLDRFLILGNAGGSYYASEKQMTVENATAVTNCLAEDYDRAVNRIVEISESGRAPKNDPAIFALAMACGVKNRTLASTCISKVCRTATHLFQFCESVRNFRGWGPRLRKGVGSWYVEKTARELAYQVTKYQSRNGWSHRDLLRLTHPKVTDLNSREVIAYTMAIAKDEKVPEGFFSKDVPYQPHLELLAAVECAKQAANKGEIVKLITDHDLVRECIPTKWLNEPEVWEALLHKMPMTAMIRNLGTMSSVGLLTPLSVAAQEVVNALTNVDRLKKARVHPIALLTAQKVYAAGRGVKGKNTWTPVSQVVDALDLAFHNAFAHVEPTGKRWLLGLDVSGSMDMGTVAGIPGLTPRIMTGALAMVTARTEPRYHTVAFTSSGWHSTAAGPGQYAGSYSISNGISEVPLSPRQRLDDVCTMMHRLPMGGTDCALPMLYALENKIPVDVFAIYTDNETWAGKVHPSQALTMYREKMGIPSKLIVVGMVSNNFSIADPNDAYQMDVVGMDTNVPQIMADFARS